MPTDKQQKAMSELRTEINKTETQLSDLYSKMNDLPANNFIGKVELIKENVANSKTELKQWADLFSDAGKKLTVGVTAPIIAGFAASTKAATDWESALNGIRKTTDMNEQEINALGNDLKDMALNTTYSSTELANLAQIAGQLGVRGSEQITKFVQVVSDMGIATELSAEDAATALARIFNITEGGNLENLEAIGSVIVHLGNNMATTEPEIVAMANRMASAGHNAGLTTDEIFALSAALTSVGITAEAGGSTVGQVLSKIEKDFAEFTDTGEGDLLRIAEISGMSAEQFAEVWRSKPVEAFGAFVTGLGNLEDGTENITLLLDELGMAGIRESNMLKALASAQDETNGSTGLFTQALNLAKEAYAGVNEEGEQFDALQKEADVRKGETATAFANFAEAVRQLGQAFGEVLLPVVTPVVRGMTDLLNTFSDISEPARVFIVTVLGLLATVGPVLSAIGGILSLINTFKVAADTVGGAMELLAMGKWVLIGGAVIAAIGAIVAAIVWLKEHSEDIARVWEDVKEGLSFTWEAIKLAWEEGCDLVTEKLNEAGEFIEQVVSDIDEFIQAIFNGGKEFIKAMVDGINSNLESALLWFSNKVTTIFNSVSSFVSNTVTNIKNAIVNGFTNAKSRAVELISSMGSSIKNTLTNLASSAWRWGSDIIHNIASGISSAIGSVISAVSNVANTIWSYLHFSEPEKGALANFHSWMPDMMKGLAKGIDDNVYLVDNAINRVADSLGMGGQQYNYGGVNIILNVPQGANGYQMVDEIEDALAQRTVRRKAVFG